MGLFSSSKKTYVSSQTFPLGGEFEDRVKFLQSTVIGSIMDNSRNRNISESIVSSYLNGPGIKLKSFGRWLERENYWEIIGQNKTFLTGVNRIDSEILAKYINNDSNYKVSIVEVEVGYPTAETFVLKYMLDNFPEFSEFLNLSEQEIEEKDFSITLPNNSNGIPIDKALVNYKDDEFFVPILVGNTSMYLSAVYSIFENTDKYYYFYGEEDKNSEEYKLIEDKSEYELVPFKEELIIFRDLEGNDLIEELITYKPDIKILRGFKKYEHENKQIKIDFNEFIEENAIEEIIEEVGEKPNIEGEEILIGHKIRLTKTRNLNRENNKTTVIAEGENVSVVRSGVFLYKEGEGVQELDNLFYGSPISEEFPFYPVMPVRLNYKTIYSKHWEDVYEANSKGYKKLTSQNYNKLVDEINDSSGLGDIATGFMQFGTSANTRDPSAKEYIFKFFNHYFNLSKELPNSSTWVDENIRYSNLLKEEWNKYVDCVNNNMKVPFEHMQSRCYFPSLPSKFTKVPSYSVWDSNMHRMGYHIGFTWEGQSKITGKGKYKGLKPGEYKVENGGNKSFSTGYSMANQVIWEGNEPNLYWVISTGTKNIHRYLITHQKDSNNWEQLIVYNMQTQNIIKDGKGSYSGPFDKNEGSNESACIIPLNLVILRQMSLKNLTQFSIGTQYLTFTAWKTVKTKWYKKGVFKIVTVAITIAVSIYFTPAGAGMAGGLLGANAALGSMIGLTGVAGVVAGAIINSVAAMVVTSVITSVSSKLFGEALGGIVANIASFAVMHISSLGDGSFSFNNLFDGLMKSDNILSLATSVGKGYLQYSQEKKFSKLEDLQKEITSITNKTDELNKKIQDDFGKMGIINPLDLTDPLDSFMVGESKDDFIRRTLMLGSDVAEMTHNLINNYAQINLELSLN